MAVTSRPAACSERIAASRPAPGPRTKTLTWRIPCSMALRAAESAARPAAYGVLLREPLKPDAPEDPQVSTLPSGSVIVTMVLLKLDWMYALPRGTFFRSRRRTRAPAACAVRRSAMRLLLRRGLLTAGDSPARSLAGARVRPSTLAVHRQPAAVTDAAVAIDLHQPLDVQVDLTPQVTFDRVLAVDDLAQARDLVFAQITGAAIGRSIGPRQDLVRRRMPDAEDKIGRASC